MIGRNGEGVPVVRYLPGEREGRPWADLLEVVDETGGIDPVEFVRTEMAGWVVSGTPEFGLALLEHGATVLRHAHAMRRDLVADPPPADWTGAPLHGGLRAVPCDRAPEDLFEAWRAAFAPGHPDHFAGDDRQALAERIAPLLAGEVIGPVLPSSLLAVDAQDRVVAGIVLTDRGGLPWIADVFRHPEPRLPGPRRGPAAPRPRRRRRTRARRGAVGRHRRQPGPPALRVPGLRAAEHRADRDRAGEGLTATGPCPAGLGGSARDRPDRAYGRASSRTAIPANTVRLALSRRRPSRSRNTTVAIRAAITMLVSRSAAIVAKSPRDCAHTTRP